MSHHDDHLPKLLPGEEIVNIKAFKPLKLKHMPSTITELSRLAGVSKSDEIGRFGPVMAARPLFGERSDKQFRRYEALFGRDSLRVALNLLERFPKLARSTLVVLAELQGVTYDDKSEEEPGRIVHEVRDPETDPVAQDLIRDYGWGWPYYGSVDATPEYIRLLLAYCRRTDEGYAFLNNEYIGRDGRAQTMAESLVRAVNWIIAKMDENQDGLIEFKRSNPLGIENQAWRDSWDSYFHADGTMANHKQGIASVEVQRVAYDALLDAAEVYEQHLGYAKKAADLRERAEHLKSIILSKFWIPDRGGYFALGTDRDAHGKLRLLKVKTSNMGHLLHSRLLMGGGEEITHKREALIAQLFSPDMLCMNGIRTLAADEIRYRPGAYHNGSCWGWDNYMISQGLDLHGYLALGDYIEQIIVDDIDYAQRFVEFMRGDNDPSYRINLRIVDVWDAKNKRLNRVEQPPQDMQAWTTAAVLAIKLERQMRKTSRLSYDPSKRTEEHRILQSLSDHAYLPKAKHIRIGSEKLSWL
jgi:glycogen debranching enzyme